MNIEKMFKHQCKLVNSYHFDKCCVTTCKNHSPILCSGCMLAERRETLNSEKGMSDHEIKYFKGYSDVKHVTKNKKQAFDAVYSLLIFDRLHEFCATMPYRNFNSKLYNNKRLKRIVNTYPFNLKEFSFNLSVLSYMFREDIYDSFSIRTSCAMCADYSLSDVLGLSTKTLSRLCELFETMELPNGRN